MIPFNSSSNKTTLIQKIAVVGGFKGFEDHPESNDYKFVMPTLDYMRRSGFDVAAKPEFDVINFEDRRNFLEEDQEYDAVCIAYIRNGRKYHHLRGGDEPLPYRNDYQVTDRALLSSTLDRDNTPKKYRARIARSKAKIVACNGGPYEVILPWIDDEHMMTLASPQLHDDLLYMRYEPFSRAEMQKVQGEDTDLPFQWLGIAVCPEYLRAHQSRIAAGTTHISKKVAAIDFTRMTPQRVLAI